MGIIGLYLCLLGCGEDARVCSADYQLWPFTVQVVNLQLAELVCREASVTIRAKGSSRIIPYRGLYAAEESCGFFALDEQEPPVDDGPYYVTIRHPSYEPLIDVPVQPVRHDCAEYWKPLEVMLSLAPR